MRRIRALAMVVLTAVLLSACHPLIDDTDAPISIYATFYPIYSLASAVVADVPNVTLRCLVQPQDGCLRRYSLSDWDLAVLSSSADAVIMGGRGLESFEETLFNWGENGPAMTAVLYNLELYAPEMSSSDGAEEDSHWAGQNPHLYLSLDGAEEILESIAASMASLDPVYAERYNANTDAAAAELEALKAQIKAITGDLSGRRVLLMNEALVYVARDYGLEIVGRHERESGTDLSSTQLRQWLDALSKDVDAAVVLVERQAPKNLTDALEKAGYRVARIDILSTRRESDGFQGYLDAQLENARALAEAFSDL